MPINTNTGVFPEGLYAVTVTQKYINTDVLWVNRWLIKCYEDTSMIAMMNFADALANFHADVLEQGAQVYKVTVSTYEKDSNPYDGNELAVFKYTYHGRALINKPLPLHAVVQLDKVTLVGKWGRVFLRGAVGEDDVLNVLGRWVLEPVNAVAGRVNSAANTRLQPYADDERSGIKIVLKSRNNIRNVIGFAFAKVTTNRFDRKYRDKQNTSTISSSEGGNHSSSPFNRGN